MKKTIGVCCLIGAPILVLFLVTVHNYGWKEAMCGFGAFIGIVTCVLSFIGGIMWLINDDGGPHYENLL